MEDILDDHLLEMDLQADTDITQHLKQVGKWAKFISVIMFVSCALILIIAVVKMSVFRLILSRLASNYPMLNDLDEWVLWTIVIVSVALFAVTYYFLYRFSKKIKLALRNGDTTQLNAGLRALKIFFMIATVFSLLLIVKNIINLF
jgi:hypothetical protein